MSLAKMQLPIAITSYTGEAKGKLELITTDIKAVPNWITEYFKVHKGTNDHIIISGRDHIGSSIMAGRIDGQPICFTMDVDKEHSKGKDK